MINPASFNRTGILAGVSEVVYGSHRFIQIASSPSLRYVGARFRDDGMQMENPNRSKQAANSAFFVLGLVFFTLGLNNSAFFAVGIVFLVIGLVNMRRNRS